MTSAAEARKRQAASRKKPAKKPGKKIKKGQMKYYLLGGFAVLSLIMYIGLQPLKGGIHYGICRTFVEMQLKYPTSFEITSMDAWQGSIRIYFTYIHPFGTSKSSMVECVFEPDNTPGGLGYRLAEVKRDRKKVPQDLIDNFNETLPAVVAGQPDLVLPKPPTDDLRTLKRD